VPVLLEKKLRHLNPEEKEIMQSVVLEYEGLFKKMEDGTIPCTNYGYHEIKAGGALPVKKRHYGFPYAVRDEKKKQIER
jgi:hypothetical protein